MSTHTATSTGFDRIEAAAAAAGWTSEFDKSMGWIETSGTANMYRVYRKPASKRKVRVYFGVYGQVIDATRTTASKVRFVSGKGKAETVIAFINGADL